MHNYIHNISSDENVSVSTDHHTVPKLFYDSWIEWTFQPVYPPKLPSHKVRPPACIPLWEISTDVCNLQIITPTAFFLPALLFLQSLFSLLSFPCCFWHIHRKSSLLTGHLNAVSLSRYRSGGRLGRRRVLEMCISLVRAVVSTMSWYTQSPDLVLMC